MMCTTLAPTQPVRVLPSAHGYRARMNDAASPTDDPADAGGTEDDVDVADVSGGAVPEQLLEDPPLDGEDATDRR